eukprot:CAMPEP_0185695986 /NCGR_PEP_ID=MMETSP1164-20130828/4856_1 /TAXON_ID=1104430 /ORGANISM="Chrysoreinhardia sp, Strain CCMP2950" /LENGTH=109 /DNA_ID=CAMNT_0028362857 /DNA_START=22 /DNA_END=352 /DNA_ORIENTATION=+
MPTYKRAVSRVLFRQAGGTHDEGPRLGAPAVIAPRAPDPPPRPHDGAVAQDAVRAVRLDEARRAETWPFIVGMAATLYMGLMLNRGITEEDKKNSAYYKQFVLNDRSGH